MGSSSVGVSLVKSSGFGSSPMSGVRFLFLLGAELFVVQFKVKISRLSAIQSKATFQESLFAHRKGKCPGRARLLGFRDTAA